MAVHVGPALLLLSILFATARGFTHEQHKRLQMTLKNPVVAIGKKLHKVTQRQVCYDTVGCFKVQFGHIPLKRLPESPEYLDTEFYLFRRNISFDKPEMLNYGDDQDSLKRSKFVPGQDVKILIHGFLTRWNEEGALRGARAYLDIGDVNMVIVNWEKGAKGPRYTTAAANTEVVGRQLGLLLLEMVSIGVDPARVHIIGFSLGAHVAAVASEVLKEKGMVVGRITGLDPASPLFKLDHFKDKEKKLDKSDAAFVDVIHTDGSPTITDGFGLIEPLGHVDFYPNGGQEQPGCNDVKASVVVSQFETGLDRDIACSHIRAYSYFLETLLRAAGEQRGCQFYAWNCPRGADDFYHGRCFPSKATGAILSGRMGENSFGQGSMYLATRSGRPFCGAPVQAEVHISPETKPSKGILDILLDYNNSTTTIKINCDIQGRQHGGKTFYGVAAVEHESLDRHNGTIRAEIVYKNRRDDNFDRNRVTLRSISLIIDRVVLRTMDGKSWYYCGRNFIESKYLDDNTIYLKTEVC